QRHLHPAVGSGVRRRAAGRGARAGSGGSARGPATVADTEGGAHRRAGCQVEAKTRRRQTPVSMSVERATVHGTGHHREGNPMRRTVTALVGGLTVLALAACGEPGSAGGGGGGGGETGGGGAENAGGEACEPIAGEQIVVLEDDENLQSVENNIPAINADAAEEPLIAA